RTWKVKPTIAGVSAAPTLVVSGGFEAHHPIPPGADIAQGEVNGGWTADSGASCSVGSQGYLNWSARRGR
ncbi:MAG TPA: hypothetical protein VL977_07530, partial [Solirubrobacteraceae bacterium]|nr:hypothetical protein [Solirubrobacteraceae bacterium]